MNNKKAITIIELVIVVTILAVLFTIAFLSFKNYTLEARDSARLLDIASMKKSLQLYITKESKFPTPSNVTDVYFSWWLVWSQWTFWDSVFKDVKRISNIPVDPLNKKEYSYSLANNWFEYQIWAIFEWTQTKRLVNKTNANSKVWRAYITWNYNWTSIKVESFTNNYILAVPSITSSDLSSNNLINYIENNNLVFYWENNLPYTYLNSWYDINAWKDKIKSLDKEKIVLYEWNLDLLLSSENINELKKIISNLKDFYIWTSIESKLQNLDENNISKEEIEFIKNIILNNWKNIVNIENNN